MILKPDAAAADPARSHEQALATTRVASASERGAPLTADPEVSIVVPTFNRRASLRRLLETLAAHDYPAERYEVLVVDDGSEDGSPELVATLRMPYAVRLLKQPHRGPAQARNLGVSHARGSLIVFLDDDVVPRAGLIAAHVAAHQRVAGESVVIGPMSPPPDWARSPWVRWEEQKLEDQYQAMLAGRFECTPRQFYTGNSSLPRALFQRCGGFDPAFRRAEDVELGYRIRDLGARFLFEPRADVSHYANRSFAAWCRTPYQYGRYDVVMSRDKGNEALDCALREFHLRHQANRWAARLVTGRPLVGTAITRGLGVTARAAAWAGLDSLASRLLSGLFNLLYWQGVCDELGGRTALWRAIGAGTARRA